MAFGDIWPQLFYRFFSSVCLGFLFVFCLLACIDSKVVCF